MSKIPMPSGYVEESTCRYPIPKQNIPIHFSYQHGILQNPVTATDYGITIYLFVQNQGRSIWRERTLCCSILTVYNMMKLQPAKYPNINNYPTVCHYYYAVERAVINNLSDDKIDTFTASLVPLITANHQFANFIGTLEFYLSSLF